MQERNPRPGSSILVVAGLFVLLACLKAAAEIVVPFLLAVFLATLAGPAVFWLHRHRVPRILAILVVVVAMVGFLTLVGTVAVNSLQAFNQNLPAYQARLTSQMDAVTAWLQDILDRFDIELARTDLWNQFNLSSLASVAGSTLLQFGNVLTKLFLAVMMVLFMLVEAFRLPTKVTQALGQAEKTWAGFRAFAASVQKYLAIKTVTSLATGTAACFWVWLLDIDYPVFWGLLAFLFNYIPNIGSIFAATPAVLMAIVQHGLGSALAVALGYLVINILIGAVIEPKTMGDGVGLSPLIVLLSLVFWGWLLGAVGMFLSTPLTISVKIALANYSETRWISTMIGSGKG